MGGHDQALRASSPGGSGAVGEGGEGFGGMQPKLPRTSAFFPALL